ncbi:hypothetical protein PBOI14_27500 [Pseudomonas sp. Boi14]|nr:hypothetical protein PBOI14_27500 [Pseudomonas sp. Boi14]
MPQISNFNHQQTEDAIVTKRIMASAVLVVLLTAALVVRLYFLQVTQHEYQVAVAEKNRVHIRLIPPERGLIYDRNNVVLADNVASFNLTLTRERAGDVGVVLGHLARILQLPEAERSRVEKELRRARRAFEPVTLMLDLTEKQIAQVAVNQFLLPGVEVQAQFLRQYPMASILPTRWGMSGGSTSRSTSASIRPDTCAAS